MLRPGIVGMRGSMAIRLRTAMHDTSTHPHSSLLLPSSPRPELYQGDLAIGGVVREKRSAVAAEPLAGGSHRRCLGGSLRSPTVGAAVGEGDGLGLASGCR